MKKILSLLIVVGMTAPLAGCIVATRSRGQSATRRDCPPSTHWDGYGCVHNGHGNGNGRDHRR